MIRRFDLVKKIAAIIGAGLLISVYYLLNMLALSRLEHAADVLGRIGGEYSHRFRFASVWKSYARNAFLAGLLFAVRGIHDIGAIFVSSLLGSYFIVVNAQVITGINPQPDHWYRTLFLPLALAIAMICAWLYQKFAPLGAGRYNHAACTVFLAYLFFSAFYAQFAYSVENAKVYAMLKPCKESYEWFTERTPKGSVVAALSFSVNSDVQLFTHNKIFLPFGLMTLASDRELRERYMTIARIWGMTEEEFVESLRSGGVAYYLFTDKYADHSLDANFRESIGRNIPAEEVEQWGFEYRKFLETDRQTSYRMDFLYVSKYEKMPASDPARTIPGAQKKFENSCAAVYATPVF